MGWRLPMTVAILPGLKWRGKLTIKARADNGYVVGFNAQARDDSWVYDCTVMTGEQLATWTGQTDGD